MPHCSYNGKERTMPQNFKKVPRSGLMAALNSAKGPATTGKHIAEVVGAEPTDLPEGLRKLTNKIARSMSDAPKGLPADPQRLIQGMEGGSARTMIMSEISKLNGSLTAATEVLMTIADNLGISHELEKHADIKELQEMEGFLPEILSGILDARARVQDINHLADLIGVEFLPNLDMKKKVVQPIV